MNCPTCHAERCYEGVLYPFRPLCRCEKHDCRTCGKKAVVVEFQRPIKDGKEPRQAVYGCADHAPEGYGVEKRPARASLPANMDPQWPLNALPRGATSHEKVECSGCRDVHEMRRRKMHNGTHSTCPKCGFGIYTHAWDEEDQAA